MHRQPSADAPGAPGAPGASGQRLPVVAGGLLAGALALGGCGAPAPAPADLRAQSARSKGQVLAVSRDVLGRLTEVGAFAWPAHGEWSTCHDIGHAVLYHVTARLDPPPTATPGLAAVRARLEADGLALRTTSEDPWTLEGTHDGVTVQLTGYQTQTMVLFDIWGPCRDVGELDDELLDEPAVQLAVE